MAPTYDSAVLNVLKLHEHFTGFSLHPDVFHTAVNSDGWAISRLLTTYWTDASKTLPDFSSYSLFKEAIYIPHHIGSLYLLKPDRSVTKTNAELEYPSIIINAYQRLPMASLSSVLLQAATTASDLVLSHFRFVDDAKLHERKKVCSACPFWVSGGYAGLGQCKRCGCSGIKLRFEASKCPIGSW